MFAELIERFSSSIEWLLPVNLGSGSADRLERLSQLKLEPHTPIAKYTLCSGKVAWLLVSNRSAVAEGVQFVWTTEPPEGHEQPTPTMESPPPPEETILELAALAAWTAQTLTVEGKARYLGNVGGQRSRQTEHVQVILPVEEDKLARAVVNLYEELSEVSARLQNVLKEGFK